MHPPPSVPADFAITVSSNSLSLSQATTAPVAISITGQNGFTGSVAVALTGLPNGVLATPPGPFTLAVGTNITVVLGAIATASIGSAIVTAQGTSGSQSHSATFSLQVQSGIAANLPRTNYVRTDAISAFDDPFGEPRHRHIAYDSANRRIFVANCAMNRVEVFSTIDQTRIALVAVSGASSVDVSADGETIWVGTVTEQVIAIDAASLHVRAHYPIPSLTPTPGSAFDRPEELLALANGKIMLRLRQSSASESLLALWDPISNAVTNLTSVAPALFQNGLGPMTGTRDRTKVEVASNDTSGGLAIIDNAGNLIAGPQSLGAGTISRVAANPDGSRFVALLSSNGVTQLYLLDASLNTISPPIPFRAQSLLFSLDGNFLFASTSPPDPSVITVLDGHTLQSLGQVSDPSILAIYSEIEEVDETNLLFAVANRGVTFLDASHPAHLPSVPTFSAPLAAQPSGGPFTGGTSTLLTGQHFSSITGIKFGSQLATVATALSATQVQTISPPSIENGGVNVTSFFSDGSVAIAPDAFSYGPEILEVLPNAGTRAGGTSLKIYGYGFGGDPTQISVKIGGLAAAVQQIENVTSIADSLGLDATYPFPLQRVTALTPSGTPGLADISITTPSGTTASAGAFQYLQSSQVYTRAALFKFILYDERRQWLYLVATDHIDVFDLAIQQFHAVGIGPPGGPPPNAALRGLSLTPDGTHLVVADFGAQSIYLLNPDSGGGDRVAVGGVAGFVNSGPARVAATSAQTIFVAMSGEGGSSGACSACLSQLDISANPPTVRPAPQPEVATLTGIPLVQAISTGDLVFLGYDAVPGGPAGIWSATSPGQFATSAATESIIDLAAASDGTTFTSVATNGITQIRRTDLTVVTMPFTSELERIANRASIPGLAMHPTGALLYQPFLTGPAPSAPGASGIQGGIDVLDAHTGRLRLRLFLPEPLAALSTDIDGLHGSFLAVDENGQRIFALTSSGLTVTQLARVPLGIGTVFPTSGAMSGGTILTVRGSGFEPGIRVSIGGTRAIATTKDINTLSVATPALNAGPQQITITNPDGNTYTLEAAFTAN